MTETLFFALHDNADRENGLDFDNENLADPDSLPELETSQDEIAVIGMDVDSDTETLENNHRSPASNKETPRQTKTLLNLHYFKKIE